MRREKVRHAVSIRTLCAAALLAASHPSLARAEDAVEGADGAEAPETVVDIGGALRYNFFYKTWEGEEANQDRFGDIALDTFRINADVTRGPVYLSAEYRFYAGYSMIKQGWVGWKPADWIDLQFGVNQVPFGIQQYASHSWWFDIGYYLGFEDDHDLGVKAVLDLGDLDVHLAFYKNDEGHYTGDSVASARYAYDVVPAAAGSLSYAGFDGAASNSETNQFNVKGTYTLSHGDLGRTEVGLAGQFGQLFNSATEEFGTHYAASGHVVGDYGPINVQLMGIYYSHAPENAEGEDDRFVVMGAYDFPYKVASEGIVVHANIAYTLEIDDSVVRSLTFYNDFSVLTKSEEDYEDSQMNVLGMLLATGHIYCYFDLAMGKNHPWLGGNYGNALAEGDPDAEWEQRFNINLGYYF